MTDAARAGAGRSATVSRRQFISRRVFVTSGASSGSLQVAMMCVSRYENTGNIRYRDLVHAAADAYRSTPPPDDADPVPETFGHAISLELAAWRSTARPEYLEHAAKLADLAMKRFLPDGPLPRSGPKAPHYDASSGAGTLALTSATFGIVCGGLTGTPVGTWLIHRYHLAPSALPGTREVGEEPHGPQALVIPTDREDPPLVLNMIVLAAAMGLGSILSRWFAALDWTLPAYIGAMIIATIFRNVDDRTGWLKIDPAAMDVVGGFALNIFLVVALMDLKLWQLAGQALPLFVILAAQVVLVAIFALTASFLVMGRDYDSAVMSAGFVGFVLGTTANAVANMRALVTRYGPAPRAFLVVPLVGAFFIDFANAIIITFYVNWLR